MSKTKSDPYHSEYDGFYIMKWHDNENELKRWFENYKVDKYAGFATEYEWLCVEPRPTRRGERYISVIGDDGRSNVRIVEMDYSAPPAPTVWFAAKKYWRPPPPKTPAELRKEAEWEYMSRRGYEPVRRPIYAMPSFVTADLDKPIMDATIAYRTEWVKRSPIYNPYWDARPVFKAPVTPPAPKHRRNV